MSDILDIDFIYSGKVCINCISYVGYKFHKTKKTFTENAGNTISGIQTFTYRPVADGARLN